MKKIDWNEIYKFPSHGNLVCKIYDYITLCKLLDVMIHLRFLQKLVLHNLVAGVCAIVSQTILSHMLEDSSRAHSGDISKANSAVTANAENPFITLKRLFSPVGTSTRRLFCIQVSVFGTVFNILEHRADNVSVQYWIYLIPPDWVARHTVNSRSNRNFLLGSKLISPILRTYSAHCAGIKFSLNVTSQGK